MRVAGLISGTSHDGIDAATVDFALDGDVLEADIVAVSTTPYDAALRARLAASLPPAAVAMAEVCALDTLIGQAFAAVAASCGPVDLVCSHGQTVFHWVDDGVARGTLQLGQPAWIACRTGVPVISNLRSKDVVLGGQGAPLVPVLDALLLADVPGVVAAVNIGGISNVTVRTDDGMLVAYDIGPGNALIDASVVELTGEPFDRDGRIAAEGRVDAGLLADLLAEPYYALAAPKSTGKELFNAAYLTHYRSRHPGVAGADMVATLTALTVATIAAELRRCAVDAVVVTGGGWSNPVLRRGLQQRLDVRWIDSASLGVPAAAKEAVAFALIGWYTAHGLPAALPSCTGAAEPAILGSITPGAGPLVLPPPMDRPPAALRLRASRTPAVQ